MGDSFEDLVEDLIDSHVVYDEDELNFMLIFGNVHGIDYVSNQGNIEVAIIIGVICISGTEDKIFTRNLFVDFVSINDFGN